MIGDLAREVAQHVQALPWHGEALVYALALFTVVSWVGGVVAFFDLSGFNRRIKNLEKRTHDLDGKWEWNEP